MSEIKRFAKIIEVDGAQVLFKRGVDHDHDEATLEMIALGSFGEMCISLGYKTEEAADQALNKANEDHARNVLKRLAEAEVNFAG